MKTLLIVGITAMFLFSCANKVFSQVMTTNIQLLNLSSSWHFYPPLDANTKGYMFLIDLSLRGPGNYHGDVFASVNGTNLTLVSSTADVYSSWFRASYGQEFRSNTLSSFITLDQQPAIPQASPFYLAVHLDSSPNISAYGWAEFQNTFAGELTLLASGITYDNSGVLIGMITPVPEPAAFNLFLVGIFIMPLIGLFAARCKS